MSKWIRRIGSIKSELLKGLLKTALASVQTFKSTNMGFKSVVSG